MTEYCFKIPQKAAFDNVVFDDVMSKLPNFPKLLKENAAQRLNLFTL